MTMQWVRSTYGVPAKRGGRIAYTANGIESFATILGATHLLHVRFDSGLEAHLHPTWKVRYVDPQPSRSGEPS